MIQFTIVVVLKAGDLPVGKYNLKITLVKPNGEETQSQEAQAFFSASGESGIAVISPVVIPAPDEGLHWFDVYFEEKQITRIPVRVLYQEVPILQMPSAPPH
jgi:hypothetical protein